jgi:phosphoglucomutase
MRFKNILETLKDDKCSEFIVNELQSIALKRQGLNLKRSPWDYLHERGFLNAEDFIRIYVDSVNKVCDYPTRVRYFVRTIVLDAMYKTNNFYMGEKKDEGTEDIR